MPSSIVFNEDCLPAMKRMPDKAFDLALCDVPYGIGVGKMAYLKARKPARQKNGNMLMVAKTIYENENWDNETPSQEYFDELRRVSHHQIIFGIDYCKWEGVGAGRIVWDKCVAEGVGFSKYEAAFCSLIDDVRTVRLMWAGMMQAKSLAEPTTQQGNKRLNEKRIHPTQKPVLLYKRLLLDFARCGWRIIDTHVGSGSSQIAAYELGYDFTGYETSRKHFERREKRFALAIQQQALF